MGDKIEVSSQAASKIGRLISEEPFGELFERAYQEWYADLDRAASGARLADLLSRHLLQVLRDCCAQSAQDGPSQAKACASTRPDHKSA